MDCSPPDNPAHAGGEILRRASLAQDDDTGRSPVSAVEPTIGRPPKAFPERGEGAPVRTLGRMRSPFPRRGGLWPPPFCLLYQATAGRPYDPSVHGSPPASPEQGEVSAADLLPLGSPRAAAWGELALAPERGMIGGKAAPLPAAGRGKSALNADGAQLLEQAGADPHPTWYGSAHRFLSLYYSPIRMGPRRQSSPGLSCAGRPSV